MLSLITYDYFKAGVLFDCVRTSPPSDGSLRDLKSLNMADFSTSFVHGRAHGVHIIYNIIHTDGINALFIRLKLFHLGRTT